MSFNQIDTHNMKLAQSTFGSEMHSVNEDRMMLYRVPITQYAFPANASEILADSLMSATRLDQDVTCWIDVQTPHLPDFIEPSLLACAGFGLRLVITHHAGSSHGPGQRLPLHIMKAVAEASSNQDLWNPFANRMVPNMKYWVQAVAELPADHPVFSDPRWVAGYYHAIAEILPRVGQGFITDALLVRMGGMEIARIAADDEDLKIFERYKML